MEKFFGFVGTKNLLQICSLGKLQCEKIYYIQIILFRLVERPVRAFLFIFCFMVYDSHKVNIGAEVTSFRMGRPASKFTIRSCAK